MEVAEASSSEAPPAEVRDELAGAPWKATDVLWSFPLALASLYSIRYLKSLLPEPWDDPAAVLAAFVLCGMFVGVPYYVAKARGWQVPLRGWMPALRREWLVGLLLGVVLVEGMVYFKIFLKWILDVQSEAPAMWEGLEGLRPTWRLWIMLTLVVTVVPVGEELFFRGMILGGLRKVMPLSLALLIQALVFAAVHPLGFISTISIAGLGLALGVLYCWRKTLVASILAHAMFNFVAAGYLAYQALNPVPHLGIAGTNADPTGIEIQVVLPESPAEAAGIHVGDVLIQLSHKKLKGETKIEGVRNLRPALETLEPGDQVKVLLLRGDEQIEVQVTLSEPPDE